jgi:prepilin-type N-terminal cleavage/methylation domain-containing protein
VAVELNRRYWTRDAARGSRSARGLTLIEVLIAAALLGVIMVGMIPLFTRSILANQAGWESSRVSSLGKSQVEQYIEAGFNTPPLTLAAGSELVSVDYYSDAHHEWMPGEDPETDDSGLWFRTTSVRQYHISAVDDGILDPAEALPANADPVWINLKEVEILVENRRGAALIRPDQALTLHVVKAQ